ncbi:serine/threonine-protein kinase [Streptomyces sp. NPDC023588]|uniref:serine/threonine-protein kinase n=1 Tax=Streptomyces sp. NPDC023588 TaxID=3154907 RepID=UPI0033E2FA7B
MDVPRAGLVHRDLKPSNVLLAEDGVRVIDFGIARAAEGHTKLTHTGAMVGSPPFMAPEQVQGLPLTGAADVFSLGSTLVKACAGRPPFAGTSVPGVLYNVAHGAPDLDGVPQGLRPFIEPCLAKEPAERPSPLELLTAVGTVTPRPGRGPRRYTGSRPNSADIDQLADGVARPAGTTGPAASAVPPVTAPATLPAPMSPPLFPPVPPAAAARRGRTWWLAGAAAVTALMRSPPPP